MGTTPEQVADFEDFHRRLEKELNSRESELEEVWIIVSRLSPSTEKSSLEVCFTLTDPYVFTSLRHIFYILIRVISLTDYFEF
jgi:hypothetical protein